MKIVKVISCLILLCLYANAKSFKVGVFPYTNAIKIAKIYQPFNEFLSNELNTSVEIYTSKTYEQFYKDTNSNEFDLIITGPHMGTLHIQNGFNPVYRYNTNLKPLFVVLKESKYTKISDLKNSKIALSTKLSVSSMGGIKTLIDSGFENEKDFHLVVSKSHTSAIKSVILGECDAAITTYTPIKQLTDQVIKSKIRVIESDFNMPHLFILVNPDINKDNLIKIKTLLKKFENSSKGKEFFKKTGYKGYTEISQDDLNKMTPLLQETNKFLNEK